MKVILLGVLCLLGCSTRTDVQERYQKNQTLAVPSPSFTVGNSIDFKFAIVGDLHMANQDATFLNQVITAAKNNGDEFCFLLGDIVDDGNVEVNFATTVNTVAAQAWTGRVFYVIGNHELYGQGWNYFRQYYGRSQYAVDIGNSRFLVLDTGDGNVGVQQTQWLEGQLQAARPTNTFILSHYMPTVPGRRTYLKLSNEIEAKRLMKWASSYGVRGWYGGHYHSYGLLTWEGVDYVVAGGAGRRMEPVISRFVVHVHVTGSTVSYNLELIPG